MTVLLVEDDPDIRMIARMALRQAGGFTIIAAASGAEALALLAGVRPDVILLDVMMPEMDGTEVLQAVRAMSSLDSVPVIFLTAKAMPGELARLRALGARAILTKPFDPAALPGLVLNALAETDPPDQQTPAPLPAHDIDPTAVRQDALSQLSGLNGDEGQDLIGDLIDMFASTTPALLEQLRAAAGAGTADAERHAHSLKGSAAALGAVGIAELARRIESLCRAGGHADALPLVARIAGALPQAIDRLRSARTQIESPAKGPVQPPA